MYRNSNRQISLSAFKQPMGINLKERSLGEKGPGNCLTRENAEQLMDDFHDPADGKKPRTYRKCARKDYLKHTRCRKHTAKMSRKAIGKQLSYLRRDLDAIDGKLSLGKVLTARQTERLCTIFKFADEFRRILEYIELNTDTPQKVV